jgi:DNA-binding XRE family transcriptional regulator
MNAVLVKNADRMMTSVRPAARGIEVRFADGRAGMIPFKAIPELRSPTLLDRVELPSPYEIVLYDAGGRAIEIPWDFARHYCDPSYQPRMEVVATAGRVSLGRRIRELREAAGMTQEEVANAAGIGRVTLVRIERGEQSPRYQTLVSLARALGLPLAQLIPAPAR